LLASEPVISDMVWQPAREATSIALIAADASRRASAD